MRPVSERGHPRKLGQALRARQRDEFSDVRGFGAAPCGGGIQLAAQPRLPDRPGDDVASFDVIAHGPRGQRGDAASARDEDVKTFMPSAATVPQALTNLPSTSTIQVSQVWIGPSWG